MAFPHQNSIAITAQKDVIEDSNHHLTELKSQPYEVYPNTHLSFPASLCFSQELPLD